MSAALEHLEVLIVGAGFAGAATAAALTARGVRSVRVLEAEPGPGHHASGRNAAMARRVIADPVLTQLATDSVAALGRLEERRGVSLLRRTGGLLLGNEEAITDLERAAHTVPELGRAVTRMSACEAESLVPLLSGCVAPAALHTTGCGVVDIHALLSHLIAEAREGGATFGFQERVEAVEVSGGRVQGVTTSAGRYSCDVLVNASGHTAHAIGAQAGGARPPLLSVRRHLFVTAGWDAIDPSWPFVWDVSNGLYFRPEGRGLLLCMCDETPWPWADVVTSPAARERLAEVFTATMPALASVRPTRCWAGIRVLTPDGRFVIGPDPAVDGLFWVAGLGGHGMTTACGVGAISAVGIVEGALASPYAAAFAVDRFQPATAPPRARALA